MLLFPEHLERLHCFAFLSYFWQYACILQFSSLIYLTAFFQRSWKTLYAYSLFILSYLSMAGGLCVLAQVLANVTAWLTNHVATPTSPLIFGGFWSKLSVNFFFSSQSLCKLRSSSKQLDRMVPSAKTFLLLSTINFIACKLLKHITCSFKAPVRGSNQWLWYLLTWQRHSIWCVQGNCSQFYNLAAQTRCCPQWFPPTYASLCYNDSTSNCLLPWFYFQKHSRLHVALNRGAFSYQPCLHFTFRHFCFVPFHPLPVFAPLTVT